MVAVFIYSKRYGDQGPPISNPTSTHHFSMSVPLSGGTYSTRRGAIKLLADMQIKNVKTSGFNFQSGNGLLGNGLVNNPLKVDTNWIEANFINSKYWQFSQVGDPTDTDLTISGSYFSVSYPYGNEHYSPTAFVEGNGDLRVLRHVTNGEDLRVTYASWKNYRKTTISTMNLTDTVYTPPGLYPGEYIHNVYHMSSRAMLAEIWVGVAFKEFVFITLNGTAVDKYHTLLRLANNPTLTFTGFGTFSAGDRRRAFHSSNVIATILNGRRYLVCVLPPTAVGSCKLQVAEVHDNGTMTLVEGFAVENTLGFRTNDQSTQTIFNKAVSFDINDLDRCFYFSDPDLKISNAASWTGPSPFIKISGQELPSEKLGIMFHMYAGCQYKSFYSGPCKAQFFYVMDVAGKTVKPEPETGYNRLYRSDPNSGLNGNIVSGPLVYAKSDHYYAQGRNFQLLPSGDRLRLDCTSDSMAVIPQISIYRGNGDTISSAMSDNNFPLGDRYSEQRSLTLKPPTPVNANCAGILVHNHLITTNQSTIGAMENWTGAWSKLVGTHTDKTYKLLNRNGVSFSEVTGYKMPSERGALSSFSLAINTFRSKTGDIFYHNACWSRYGDVNKVCDSTIDANLTPRGKYTFDINIRNKMNTAILEYFKGSNIPEGFTEIHGMNWLVIPGHMSIARDHAFYKIMISFRIPDATDPLGYRYSGTYMLGGLIGATINANSDGDCRFIDVNTDMLHLGNKTIVTGNYNIGTDEGRARLNTAIMYKESDISVILGGGFGSSSAAGVNHNGWVPHGIKTNYQNTNPNVIRFFGEIQDKIAIHKTLGLGYVSNIEAMGAMYCFKPVNEETLLADATLGGPYVLGSARPAAGFTLTVSAPVEIYNQGFIYTIPIQSIDLTKINTADMNAHKQAHLYMYAILINGVAKLKITYTPLEEHNAQIFLGHIYTSDTEITSIKSVPVSRWEMARPSAGPIGSAVPVATGVPSSLGTDSIWAGRAPGDTYTGEYLWGDEDLYDTDIIYETTIVASYWASDAAGSQGITRLSYGEPGYFIVKTQGPATELLVKISIPTANQEMFEHGVIEAWANIPINVDANGNGIGSYLIKSWSEDDMLFNNYDYVDVTVQRQAYTKYVNDTGKVIFIAISVRTNDGFNAGQLLINDKQVAYVDGHQSNGTGNWWPNLGFIIPAGMSYQFNGNPAMLTQWVELRPK